MTLRPDAAKPGTPVILGVPFDANSSGCEAQPEPRPSSVSP